MKETNEIKESKLRELWSDFQAKPLSNWVLLALIGLGVVLLISGGDHKEYAQKTVGQDRVNPRILEINQESDEQSLEKELTETLTKIIGVGEVRVDIYLRAGNRNVWERQTRISKRVNKDQETLQTEESSSDELIFAKDREGRDAPVLKERLAPEIEGVVVVAEGAHDGRIRKMLTDTVTTILGLPGHRVLIIPGNYRKE